MATAEWRKPRATMRAEAITTIAELTVFKGGDASLREMAARITITAHQIPVLVEMGAFREGDLDDEAMGAMAIVVDIAAGWDDEAESIEEFVDTLDDHDLARLAGAARLWAHGVWETMVPLSPAEKQATLAALRH
ncbi:hypothetical protein ACFQU2_23900 [Siccirubricoccus deserti]|uniref:Uncharacterized protein n=1 Tax=Siccirubricoccus deserti TaxID=2013562 RepID=A0A9X0QV67_9PROT|nr:hypothetical protein [Siccirubricoccus deserti]MBC4014504.1 hypothetical protein [Siccirubricoccus deserti]